MCELIDTCIWSESLRRKRGDPAILSRSAAVLLSANPCVIGPVRQEILSGCRDPIQYGTVRTRLRLYPDELLTTADYELAAEYSNTCRSRGVQGSGTDFLICAVSVRLAVPIFTVDRDFDRYRLHLPIRVAGPGDPV